MTRDEIIAAHPLLPFLERHGLKFKRQGGEFYAPCPFHADGNRPNFRVNEQKQTWFCDPCGFGGSVIDFVMRRQKVDLKTAMQQLGGEQAQRSIQPVEIAHYDYTDENGALLYQVVRFVPKTFRQRHKNESGEWVWNMQGVRRVLYRLPEVVAASDVFVVEGEKDVDSLRKLQAVATCNVGGAKKWLDSYSDALKGKNVVIIPDSDEAGREHADIVSKSLLGKAKAVYRLDLPVGKDVSDFIAHHGENARTQLLTLVDKLKPLNPVPDLAVKSMEELEADYLAFVQRIETHSLNLGNWLPVFNHSVRKIVPGELVVIMADTGVGKTAILQNIAHHARLITLIFELELPGTLMFERFIQMEQGISGENVHTAYRAGTPPNWKMLRRLDHIYVCPKSKLTPEEMEKIINLSELKIGQRPVLVMVDYVGLVSGFGTSRYERVSYVAEQMKVLAKNTNTIVVLASQIGRRSEDDPEVYLHDAKDSGSIENSAGLVLGAWRDTNDTAVMKLKILKNTKGPSGKIIECDYKADVMQIRYKSPVADVT